MSQAFRAFGPTSIDDHRRPSNTIGPLTGPRGNSRGFVRCTFDRERMTSLTTPASNFSSRRHRISARRPSRMNGLSIKGTRKHTMGTSATRELQRSPIPRLEHWIWDASENCGKRHKHVQEPSTIEVAAWADLRSGTRLGGWTWWSDHLYQAHGIGIEPDILAGRYADPPADELDKLLSWKADSNGGDHLPPRIVRAGPGEPRQPAKLGPGSCRGPRSRRERSGAASCVSRMNPDNLRLPRSSSTMRATRSSQ